MSKERRLDVGKEGEYYQNIQYEILKININKKKTSQTVLPDTERAFTSSDNGVKCDCTGVSKTIQKGNQRTKYDRKDIVWGKQ